MGKKKIFGFFKKFLSLGMSPHTLALSASVGLYIAFSPFPGAHTVMVFASSWLFGLNLSVVFFASTLCNPWTLIPVYSLDYAFGYWLVHYVCKWQPTWHISFAKIFYSGKICLWSFLIGGNVLGIIAAVVCYPVMRIIFRRLLQQKNQPVTPIEASR